MATPINLNPLAHVSAAPPPPRSLRRRAAALAAAEAAPGPARKEPSRSPLSSPTPPEWRESRRSLSFSLLLAHLVAAPDHAIAGSFMDKYVKKKRLDPLEAYVPAVILSQLQIKDLEKTLDDEKPEFAACRSVLRSGPAASLRVNIRAVAQYASDGGNGKAASGDVDQCLRALEDLDSLLLRASRKEPDASVKAMKAKIGIAVDALDSLLQTVPQDVLDKGKAAADAYRIPRDMEPEIVDPEIKQLESIL
ncbi:uncharacterized protein LOC104432322 [Eucalyptus grandis]|uniref:uncharacterized protein LOC104432322 n=1 Tax=Eucalyptus grandis TaxID=71139 RepID=UPI00192F0219|nr:uncharacterized protein LOC104432322 [Eucalyptus grandis]